MNKNTFIHIAVALLIVAGLGYSAITPIKDLLLQSNMNAGGYRITNLATPTATNDAVTKAYADAVAGGITNIFNTASNGLVPASTTNTAKFLRGDGTWQSVGGGGDMLSANNLSDVANVATARTNLGLVIGTHVQAYSANLTTLADNNGGSLTNLNASNLATGTVPDARLSSAVVLTNSLEATNARTPTAHTHAQSDIINLVSDLAGKASTNVFNTGTNGLVPASGTNTTKFLRGDSTWQSVDINWSSVPSATNSTGTAGQMAYSTNGYLYICITNNSWVRVRLGTW